MDFIPWVHREVRADFDGGAISSDGGGLLLRDALLSARLRPANRDTSAGCREELDRIVKQIREAWPGVKIIIRGDSGFCREGVMKWCEEHGVDYVLGLAKNERLKKAIEKELEEVAKEYGRKGKAARQFKEFEYQTRESWTPARRGARCFLRRRTLFVPQYDHRIDVRRPARGDVSREKRNAAEHK